MTVMNLEPFDVAGILDDLVGPGHRKLTMHERGALWEAISEPSSDSWVQVAQMCFGHSQAPLWALVAGIRDPVSLCHYHGLILFPSPSGEMILDALRMTLEMS